MKSAKLKPRKKLTKPPADWKGFDDEWDKLEERRSGLRQEWMRLEKESEDLRKALKALVEDYRARRKG